MEKAGEGDEEEEEEEDADYYSQRLWLQRQGLDRKKKGEIRPTYQFTCPLDSSSNRLPKDP